MAFRSLNMAAHMIKFNSATSSEFLAMYNDIVDAEISKESSKPGHKTFAPSQMRCDRISWFRLRGTEPDSSRTLDKALHFTAQIGTSCHEAIQKRLISKLGEDWISVQSWIDSNPSYFADYDMNVVEKGYESLIELNRPYPVRFACDGIVRFNDKIYLLEIKTAEFSSLNELTRPKEKHMDQIKCYSTLLHIPDVLFIYQDRSYGDVKCFEITVTAQDQLEMREKMDNVLAAVESNIAPEGLPVGDPDCTSSMCPYFKKCKSWGR